MDGPQTIAEKKVRERECPDSTSGGGVAPEGRTPAAVLRSSVNNRLRCSQKLGEISALCRGWVARWLGFLSAAICLIDAPGINNGPLERCARSLQPQQTLQLDPKRC